MKALTLFWLLLTVTFSSTVSSQVIQGSLKYDNSIQSPMINVSISLMTGNVVVSTATTDSLGNFIFPPIAPGTYDLSFQNNYLWGSVNAADALLMYQYSLNQLQLTPFEATVADVNFNGIVNTIDVMATLKRFVGQILSFGPDLDWRYDVTTVTVGTSGTLTLDIKALVAGDLNRTYIP